MSTHLLANDDIAIVIDTLPTTFRLIADLGEHLQQLDPDVDVTTAILHRDATLVSALIAAANRPPYAVDEPFETLEAVLARVGPRELFRMAGAIACRQLVEPLAVYEISAEQLHDDAVFTALVMEQLAEDGAIEPTNGFVTALLRPIGKVVLNRMARRTAEIPPFTGNVRPLAEWETAVLGYTNTEVAAAVLEHWQFLDDTIEAVRDHYAPGPKAQPITRLLQIACDAAHARGHAFPGEAAYWRISQQSLASVNLDSAKVDAAAAKAERSHGRLMRALGARQTD